RSRVWRPCMRTPPTVWSVSAARSAGRDSAADADSNTSLPPGRSTRATSPSHRATSGTGKYPKLLPMQEAPAKGPGSGGGAREGRCPADADVGGADRVALGGEREGEPAPARRDVEQGRAALGLEVAEEELHLQVGVLRLQRPRPQAV